MKNFDKTVPFDPGYSDLAFYFEDQVSYHMGAYNQIKVPHQKKFQLIKLEPLLLDLIDKSTSFYLGCMLWGGFLSSRFKGESKEITRNTPAGMSEEQLNAIDCTEEPREIIDFIKNFDRDCKYYLNRPAKVPAFNLEILNAYIEFAQINDNFIKVKTTSDVKLPKLFSHFEKLSKEELDELCDKIYAVIATGKIEGLLEIGLFKK